MPLSDDTALSIFPPAEELTLPEQKLLNFENVEKLAALLDTLSWSITDEINLLVDTARCAPNPAVRLKALAMLQDVRKEALALSGVIAKVKMTQQTNSNNTIFTKAIIGSVSKKGSIHACPIPAPQHNLPAPTQTLNGGSSAPSPADPETPDPSPAPIRCPASIPGLSSMGSGPTKVGL